MDDLGRDAEGLSDFSKMSTWSQFGKVGQDGNEQQANFLVSGLLICFSYKQCRCHWRHCAHTGSSQEH